MKRALAYVLIAICILLSNAVPVYANIFLSTWEGATLGGLTFEDGDIVEYDPATDTATLLFSESRLTPYNTIFPPDIDAIHIRDNGNIVFSTLFMGYLDSLYFQSSDLIEYNPATDTATLFFDGSDHFVGNTSYPNIDALHILDNGNLILSTAYEANIGGMLFEDGDLFEYNPTTRAASLFFDEDLLSKDDDVNGVYVIDGDTIILTVASCISTSLGGTPIQWGDLVEYHFSTDTATVIFPQSTFTTSGENIDAVFMNGSSAVPEPATIILICLGGLGLGISKKRKS